MLFSLAAPATNEHGPRYIEKALGAIHQANHERRPVTFLYAGHQGRVGLFLRLLQSLDELVKSPITAHYPNCSITTIAEAAERTAGFETWAAELQLVPELFPILRHAQFEYLLNHNFADPVSGILRAIKPDEQLECRVETTVRPASSSRTHRAARCVKWLDWEFFRHYHRLARSYARHITRPHGWLPAWLLELIGRRTAESPRRSRKFRSASSRINSSFVPACSTVAKTALRSVSLSLAPYTGNTPFFFAETHA